MTKKAEAVETASIAALRPRRRLARLAGLACVLLALLSFGACSILPAEHATDPARERSLRLIAREPNRLTFKFVAHSRPGAAPVGLTFWLGDKEHTIISLSAERGTTVLEYTPEGLFWTTEWPPEGVFAKTGHMRAGPMPLSDFAFRPDPLVPDADGRLAIADGARPGGPKVTIYLSIADFEL
ncbi:MAG: hypothetical protein ABSA67_00545 [Candidatus Brocadiia bacterium]|jgi:hypothetical protein